MPVNNTPEMSPLLIWDCAKTYLQERMIAYTSQTKRIGKQGKKPDHMHKQLGSTNILKELSTAHRELSNLSGL